MKRYLLAATAATLVMAANSPVRASDIGLAGPSYDWSGGYVGVNGGAAFDNTSIGTDYTYTGFRALNPVQQAAVDSLGLDAENDQIVFTGGVLAGYNWQYASFVFGLEGDFNYLGFNRAESKDSSAAINTLYGVPRAYEEVTYEADWYGTLRGRLGYAFGNFLVYGTGGAAYGEVNADSRLTASNATASGAWAGSTSGWNFGWTAGGGMEYGVDNWVLGAEYLYVDLASYSWGTRDLVGIVGEGSVEPAFSVARATVKYRF